MSEGTPDIDGFKTPEHHRTEEVAPASERKWVRIEIPAHRCCYPSLHGDAGAWTKARKDLESKERNPNGD